jgi:hypothetical protein
MTDPTPGYRYLVTDFDQSKTIGEFDQLTGGEMQIGMVEYNMAFDDGGSTTRFVPGQTSFAPVTLTRALTPECDLSYDLFNTSSGGKVEYKHITIKMFDQTNQDMVLWHLHNVLVTGISGFLFDRRHYTEYRVTLQPEWIEMEFL